MLDDVPDGGTSIVDGGEPVAEASDIAGEPCDFDLGGAEGRVVRPLDHPHGGSEGTVTVTRRRRGGRARRTG